MHAPPTGDQLSVTWRGNTHPATGVADGAAFELHSDRPGPGWLTSPAREPRLAYRRFVHSSSVQDVTGPAPVPPDAPILVPLRASVTRDSVQRLSQNGPANDADRTLLRAIHRSAAIRCGTRMVKAISPGAISQYLAGVSLIRGLCYRHHDVAHLRTPDQLAVLGPVEPPGDVCFVLRWRAVAPSDYAVAWQDQVPGLFRMPNWHRVGPPILGTGFAYSDEELIPEFITVDFDDLPVPVHAEILAYFPDGTEAVLYRYLAEHMWARVAHRSLDAVLTRIPDVDPAQQYHPVRATPATRLVGLREGREVEVDADPPKEFRARSRTRFVSQPVDTLARRTVRCASRTGEPFTVVAEDAGHLRVRACRPSPEAAFQHDLRCLERGIYETWLPPEEVTDLRQVDTPYDLADLLRQGATT